MINKVLNMIKEHSPEILVGTGIVGMATAGVLAVRATPKAMGIVEDTKSDLGVTQLTTKETVTSTWKTYAPSVALGVLSAGCIIAGTTTSIRRTTAMATVYAASENVMRQYHSKVVDKLGKTEAEEIRRDAVRSSVKEKKVVINDTDDSAYVTVTGHGTTMFYDSLSGRYFLSSTNAVERAVNNIYKQMMTDVHVTLNELYMELDIPTIEVGTLLGWDVQNGTIDISYDSDIDEAGNPYVIIDYKTMPIPIR